MHTATMRMMNRASLIRWFIVVTLSLLMLNWAGCDSGSGTQKEPVVTKRIGAESGTQKATPAPAAAPAAAPAKQAVAPSQLAAATTPSMVQRVRPPYNPVGKIDPFQPLFREEPKIPEVAKAEIKPKKPERPRTPLEKLDLGQLKLTAIVFVGNSAKGLVEEASGKGYVVGVGTPIGLERGKVVEITRNGIIIEQETEDDFGKSVIKKKELKLQKPPGD
jgi:type IV pilus assembly protein PilP